MAGAIGAEAARLGSLSETKTDVGDTTPTPRPASVNEDGRHIPMPLKMAAPKGTWEVSLLTKQLAKDDPSDEGDGIEGHAEVGACCSLHDIIDAAFPRGK